MKTLYISLITALLGVSAFAQQTPGKPQTKSILITNATIHVGNGTLIENGAVGFTEGKITYVGNANNAPSGFDTIMDYANHHVYPGIIAPNSTLGLVEIGAVRATRDNDEVGNYTPNVNALIAYNTESKITTTIRSNGVLLGQITPRGGVVSGTSSVVQFDAWNWEDAVVSQNSGLHLNWPHMHSRSGWWAEPGESNKNKHYNKTVKDIYDLFEKANAYNKSKPNKRDLKLEAIADVFSGKKRFYIHANYVKELMHVIAFVDQLNIAKPIIVGGYDAADVADELNARNIPVVLKRVHSLPSFEDDNTDKPYLLPKLLADKGVLFCLNNAGDMEQMGTRNLPFYAGTAVAYGMEKEAALATITNNTAKILGIDHIYGSLETGKSATLFISTGDALDMRTNNVVNAFIDGRTISLDNHQKALYRKYMGKYE